LNENFPFPVGERPRKFFTTKSTKSEGKRAAQRRKIFIPASVFVVEICYLQFPRFGSGFAALSLRAKMQVSFVWPLNPSAARRLLNGRA
jgi:hypothetical protein